MTSKAVFIAWNLNQFIITTIISEDSSSEIRSWYSTYAGGKPSPFGHNSVMVGEIKNRAYQREILR